MGSLIFFTASLFICLRTLVTHFCLFFVFLTLHRLIAFFPPPSLGSLSPKVQGGRLKSQLEVLSMRVGPVEVDLH